MNDYLNSDIQTPNNKNVSETNDVLEMKLLNELNSKDKIIQLIIKDQGNEDDAKTNLMFSDKSSVTWMDSD